MGFLRLILALSVVANHAGPICGFRLVGGQLAVQAFYIISGFYMALILGEKYIGANGSYRLFITNRFLRLYPIYWVILLLTIAYALALGLRSGGANLGGLQPYVQHGGSLSLPSGFFLVFTNLFLFLQDAVMFLGVNLSTGNLFLTPSFLHTEPRLYEFLLVPQAWTIGIEMAFYLIAPFLVRMKLRTLGALIVASLALRLFLSGHLGLRHDPWTYRFFPTELVFFLLGLVAYRLYRYLSTRELAPGLLKAIWGILLAVTLGFGFIPVPGLGPLYLLSFFLVLPLVFRLTRTWRIDAYVGELSYPIYVSHVLLLACLSTLRLPTVGGRGLSLAVASIGFAVVLNTLVARRIERFRQRRLVASS